MALPAALNLVGLLGTVNELGVTVTDIGLLVLNFDKLSRSITRLRVISCLIRDGLVQRPAISLFHEAIAAAVGLTSFLVVRVVAFWK